LTLRAQSYHSIALHLRILYACIRWADMRRDPEEVICCTLFVLSVAYKLQFVVLGGCDLVLRKKKPVKGRSLNGTARMDKVKTFEKWIDGTELKLWEIAEYWKSLENRTKRGSATPFVLKGFVAI
uniref:Ras-GEF domain-containing protein n=1 Tax=Gongylonema pulchrum TaxID=637853 RepID=A0A183E5I1_9BILA